MPHDPVIAMLDIERELIFLAEVARNHTLESFKDDGTAYRASAYSIQTISEAVRHLPDDWLANYAEIPWAAIKSAGNKIRHEYFRLDDVILWKIVTDDGPALRAVLQAMLAKHSS